jgi:glycosyltransferase involved in cell wall biosynthesis
VKSPEPLRIARIIARLNVGGPTRHVVWLTEALEGPEFHTALVTGVVPPGEDDMSDFAAARGVRPVVIPEMSREISPRDIVTMWKLFRFFRRFRPDIVHTHTAKAGTAGRIAGLLYRWTTRRPVRFVHTFHGHVFHSYYGAAKTRLFILVERLLARLNTDVIVTITEQQQQEIHETYGVGRADQFRVIRLGLDLEEFVSGERSARPPREVGIVGRIAPIKNHDLFLRVAAAPGWPEELRFVVYGDGSQRPALEARAGANVVFAGTRPARDIYQSIDVLALTSLNEGTPLTIIEAMANGIPTVSTAVGGVVDVLGEVEESAHGYDVRERGITAATNDAAGLTAGLRRLLDDEPLRTRLATRGRAYARATFSKGRLVADVTALYRELRDRR